MNRLFLIGNGFDLAHGMKSKYSDFLNWLLDGILTNLQNGKGYNDGDISIEFSKAIRNMLVIAKVNGSEVTRKSLMEKLGMVSAKFIPHGNETHTNITFKNENFILSKLLPDLSKSNWVDIENVYYNLLLRCVKHIDDPREQLSISILNRNLNFLITKLEEYLTPHDNVHEDTRFAKIFNASFNEKHFKKRIASILTVFKRQWQ